MPSTAHRENICTLFSPIALVDVHHIKQKDEAYANGHEFTALEFAHPKGTQADITFGAHTPAGLALRKHQASAGDAGA